MAEYNNDTGLPSVTDILSPYVDRRWFKQVHVDRGSWAHDGMACYATGIPFIKTGHPLWKSYIESGMKWFDENVQEAMIIEQRYTIPGLFTGQPDLICVLIDGRWALVDWKTAKAKSKTWKGQTAGYMHLVSEEVGIDVDTRVVVRLRDEFGRPALADYYNDHEDDLNTFMGALLAYRGYVL